MQSKRYRKFRDADGDTVDTPETEEVRADLVAKVGEEVGQRIGLERDMQAALRIEINQLEPGLTIIDDGAERSVDSGFIDITARDVSGTTVVIELKAGPAGQRAVAQILSYMGDVAAEEETGNVRGIFKFRCQVEGSGEDSAESHTAQIQCAISVLGWSSLLHQSLSRCLFQQTAIGTPGHGATVRRGPVFGVGPRGVRVESIHPKVARGVHRRPNRLVLKSFVLLQNTCK
jgi:hypothetical protein